MDIIDTAPQHITFCSFCGKKQHEVRYMLAGKNRYICDECINNGKEILDALLDKKLRGLQDSNITPKEIIKHLDQYVIGQDHAKKVLAVGVYTHYKRLEAIADDDEIEIQKNNVLLIGPTGTGKTYLAQVLAKKLGIPFAIGDATSLTEAGYVGDDVETILGNLLFAAGGDVGKAEHGIIYLDEVDKIASKNAGGGTGSNRDASGEGVQQALLKLLEGTDSYIPARGQRQKHPQQETIKINTSNILFICGGAFSGLYDLVKDRMQPKSVGFGANMDRDMNTTTATQKITPSDLISFGMLPEFLGRVPFIATLHELDADLLKRILTEPRNALVKQFIKLCAMENVDLMFEVKALQAIADKAVERRAGARGLKTVLGEKMLDIIFNLPDMKGSRCIITESCILDDDDPIIENIPLIDREIDL